MKIDDEKLITHLMALDEALKILKRMHSKHTSIEEDIELVEAGYDRNTNEVVKLRVNGRVVPHWQNHIGTHEELIEFVDNCQLNGGDVMECHFKGIHVYTRICYSMTVHTI